MSAVPRIIAGGPAADRLEQLLRDCGWDGPILRGSLDDVAAEKNEPLPPLIHGRPGNYVHGVCRCVRCVDATNAGRRLTRLTATERGCPPGKHGTLSGYDHYGCRCGECRATRSGYDRARRAVS